MYTHVANVLLSDPDIGCDISVHDGLLSENLGCKMCSDLSSPVKGIYKSIFIKPEMSKLNSSSWGGGIMGGMHIFLLYFLT